MKKRTRDSNPSRSCIVREPASENSGQRGRCQPKPPSAMPSRLRKHWENGEATASRPTVTLAEELAKEILEPWGLNQLCWSAPTGLGRFGLRVGGYYSPPSGFKCDGSIFAGLVASGGVDSQRPDAMAFLIERELASLAHHHYISKLRGADGRRGTSSFPDLLILSHLLPVPKNGSEREQSRSRSSTTLPSICAMLSSTADERSVARDFCNR